MRVWFLAFLGVMGFFGIVIGLIAIGAWLSSVSPVFGIGYGIVLLAAAFAYVIAEIARY